MIVCPWCGTSYLAFQPNCKNCGGPLPLPAQVEMSAFDSEDERIPEPPPAPRPISDRYIWRVMLTDGWGITGGIFALIGAIFMLVGGGLTLGIVTAFVGIPFLLLGILFLAGGGAALAWRYNRAQKLVNVLRWGQPVRGQIVDTQVNHAVQVNGRNPWTICYQYRVNGQAFEGNVTTLNTPGAQLQPGRPACVLYLPGEPGQNAIYPHP